MKLMMVVSQGLLCLEPHGAKGLFLQRRVLLHKTWELRRKARINTSNLVITNIL